MRIIAGQLSGRLFDAPHSSTTHPMSEKVRGGIFNALGDIEGLQILDAFAGSGSIAFEAISRGAERVTLIEKNRSAVEVIKKNASRLGIIDKLKIFPISVDSWIQTQESAVFDVVIVDPPYDQIELKTIEGLHKSTKDKGIFVLSYPGNASIPQINGADVIVVKSYGDAQVIFYR